MNNKLWGGRFKKRTDKDTERFSSSAAYDYKLAEYDVIGSLIHIGALKEARFISRGEFIRLEKGLLSLYKQIKDAKFSPNYNAEDIHSDIQNRLERKLGKVAGKLQTARSRNEQVVFDTKLYCKFAVSGIIALISSLEKAIDNLAGKNKHQSIPGFTHLQHAQVIKFKDYILAFFHMLQRDKKRLKQIIGNLDISLGSGALAGSPLKAYYKPAAKKVYAKLGLKGVSFISPRNTVDTTADRDFVIEILSALAILGMHLSRLAEDFIIFSTQEFAFLEIGDEFCTGSSLMPQKKNPDVLELIRGYSGRIYGNLVSVLVVMKGLPLAYNRDMQLDKEPLFSSIDIVKNELEITRKLIRGLRLNKENIKEQLDDECLYATNLAYLLVGKGLSFKQAHKIIGKLIRFSQEKSIKISSMPDSLLKRFSPHLNKKIVRKGLSLA